MSGVCNSCGLSFSVFRKESSCKNCGLVFCNDCLPKKLPIPKLNNEKHKVCLRCYNILTGKVKPKADKAIPPPDAYMKRMTALEKNSGPASTAPKAGLLQRQHSNKYEGLSKQDIEIRQRLDKLKEERLKDKAPPPSQKQLETRLLKLHEDKPIAPTADEMRERLARLRGIDSQTAKAPTVLKPDKRHEQQQIEDLLNEIRDEVDIDDRLSGNTRSKESEVDLNQFGSEQAQPDLDQIIGNIAVECNKDAQNAITALKEDKELYAYLCQMKKKQGKDETTDSSKSENGTDHDETEDGETDKNLQNIIKQFVEEQDIDDRAEKIGYDGRKNFTRVDEVPPDVDDLPWCIICNSNATLRCLGCDMDLYCRRCYVEGHDREDYADHQTIPYKR